MHISFKYIFWESFSGYSSFYFSSVISFTSFIAISFFPLSSCFSKVGNCPGFSPFTSSSSIYFSLISGLSILSYFSSFTSFSTNIVFGLFFFWFFFYLLFLFGNFLFSNFKFLNILFRQVFFLYYLPYKYSHLHHKIFNIAIYW